MIESQRDKLNTFPHRCVSIGITAEGQPVRSSWVPWHYTANAFNMRTPDLFITPEDLEEDWLWEWMNARKVNGCYIFCPLPDYSFLSRLPHLEDITIHKGGALRDLGFLRSTKDWFQLHIEDAVLENLDDLLPEFEPLPEDFPEAFPDLTPERIRILQRASQKVSIHSYCVCLSGCTVKDISALCSPDIRLSELVILAPEGSNDQERWKAVNCGKYSYFEYRVKEK